MGYEPNELPDCSIARQDCNYSLFLIGLLAVRCFGTIDQLDEGQNAEDYGAPLWTPARYRIRFINTNGRWYISELKVLEENPDAETLGTPNPNESPIPAATPTPKPTDEPTAAP